MNAGPDPAEARTGKATLEIEMDRESLRGALASDGGDRHTFTGWLEFAAAVEAWRREMAGPELTDKESR
jgi:hypothetical protein